jgi:DNA-directed RNA polymerase omega subunit
MTAMEQPPSVMEESDASTVPAEPPPPIESRFLFVDVAALRAKQLKRGAQPRLGDEGPQTPHKLERVAMEEVRRGLVHYDIRQLISLPGEADV